MKYITIDKKSFTDIREAVDHQLELVIPRAKFILSYAYDVSNGNITDESDASIAVLCEQLLIEVVSPTMEELGFKLI